MNIPQQPNTLYPDQNDKLAHSRAMIRFYNKASKLLPEFTFKKHFNPGGMAVWGETYAKLYVRLANAYLPRVEAYDTSMGLLVRQWDGHNSGANHYVKTLEQFVTLVRELSQKPFVRF